MIKIRRAFPRPLQPVIGRIQGYEQRGFGLEFHSIRNILLIQAAQRQTNHAEHIQILALPATFETISA